MQYVGAAQKVALRSMAPFNLVARVNIAINQVFFSLRVWMVIKMKGKERTQWTAIKTRANVEFTK